MKFLKLVVRTQVSQYLKLERKRIKRRKEIKYNFKK